MGQAIAGLTFIGMLFYGAGFFQALIASIVLLVLLSGVVWGQEKAESNPVNFAKGYGLITMATFVIIAILYFRQ